MRRSRFGVQRDGLLAPWGAAVLLALSLAGCTQKPPPAMQLTILHTNDIHGKFRDTPATWKDGNPPIGGFANLSAYVDSERQVAERLLLLDAGDLMTGNPICNYDYKGAKGGALIEFMNLMAYDAMALGNHEFDLGLENLDALLALAQFPILGANVEKPAGGLTTGQAYTIVEKQRLRIGIIGLITPHLYGVAAPKALAGTKVSEPAGIAQELVDKIDGKTDLIILLTHIGVDGDRELAKTVEGIDLIVGGHSHTRLNEPLVENGVLIVQAGSHGRNLGDLKVTVAGDSISVWEGGLIDLWPRQATNVAISEMVSDYSTRVEADYGQEIGRLADAWRRSSSEESNVGNWVAECFRARTGADFGLVNSGGIRKNLKAGPVTKLDILELLPFSNAVSTFQCTGAQLRTLLETTATAAAVRQRGMLHLSGVRFSYRVVADQVEIVEASVAGKPLDEQAAYRGVGNDFVVFGNPIRYLGFEPERRELLDLVDADVVIEAIEATSGEIVAPVDGRFHRLDAVTADR